MHRLDAARIYRLALENASAGARYHAVAESGVPVRSVAEAIGRKLGLPVTALSPEQAADHFDWLAFPIGMDAPASSFLTQQRLHWRPTHEYGIVDDLAG